MNKKITTIVLLAVSWVIFLPSLSAASTGERNGSTNLIPNENLVLQQRRGRIRYNRYYETRGRRRSGSWYGYRNYGQYRRTQVGNRRYRTTRQTIWRNGRRITVTRRIIY
jgi:hypothetical protein